MELGCAGTLGLLPAGLVLAGAPRRTTPALIARSPLLIAHRGGAGLAPENTLAAFVPAVRTWAADMVELDVHATADGHCVVIHDATVDRTTDGQGAVANLPLAALREFDAGYRFTPDNGRTFPFRGKGITIPTIEEVLEALPETPLIVEVKAGAAQPPLFAAIARAGAAARIIAAGMYERDRTQFRAWSGVVSASAEEVTRFFRFHALRLARFWQVAADVVQVPEYHESRRIVSQRLVRELHAQGIPVHVWTVNAESDMDRLLDWGVDGLVTDRPDVLGRVLNRRTDRPLAPGAPAGSGTRAHGRIS
jgi:glycerophosphoryl diester phosphodiesterase